MEMIENIRTLLGKSKIAEAIKTLEKATEDRDILDQILLLSARLHKYVKQEQLKLGTDETEINQVIMALLGICTELDTKEAHEEVLIANGAPIFKKDSLKSDVSTHQDDSIHIIDKIYTSLNRFKPFGFVDPDFISTIYPFNILDESVWYYYNGNLFTINSEIYELLKGIEIENGEVVFTDELQAEIDLLKVVDAKHKIEVAFEFLNDCLINEITAIKDYKQIAQNEKKTIGFSYTHSFNFKEGEGLTKAIQLSENDTCDCISCNYRSLDFNKLLEKLKSSFINEDLNTPEYAYGHYLVASNNFITTYQIYKSIEKKTKGVKGKEIEYFLTKKNLKSLPSLMFDDVNKEILEDIKSINLDKVIYDEIEYAVDKEVLAYLLLVKDDKLIDKLENKIEEITSKIKELKKLYSRKGSRHIGPNQPYNLYHAYAILYYHVNKNHIIYDAFGQYKTLTQKAFKGMVTSYLTLEEGIKSLDEFWLTEAILHINPSDLQKVLKKVDTLKTDDDCIEKILVKFNNFTKSYAVDGIFNKPYANPLLEQQLNNFWFKQKFTNIFSNIFTVLSKLDISKEQFTEFKVSLLKFLKVEKELAWFHLKEFGSFLLKKGNLFEAYELTAILKLAIDGNRYGYSKYTKLINALSKTIETFYPNHKIDSSKLIKNAILKSLSDDETHNYYHELVCLVNICDEKRKQILIDLFETELDEKFNAHLYESLLRNTDYDYRTKNYFEIYCDNINKTKGSKGQRDETSTEFASFVFINFIVLIYEKNVDFTRNELKLFTELNDSEIWLLNPFGFDYTKFDAKWLIDLHKSVILDRLIGIEDISTAIEKELSKTFNPILAEIKYKYFSTRK